MRICLIDFLDFSQKFAISGEKIWMYQIFSYKDNPAATDTKTIEITGGNIPLNEGASAKVALSKIKE